MRYLPYQWMAALRMEKQKIRLQNSLRVEQRLSALWFLPWLTTGGMARSSVKLTWVSPLLRRSDLLFPVYHKVTCDCFTPYEITGCRKRHWGDHFVRSLPHRSKWLSFPSYKPSDSYLAIENETPHATVCEEEGQGVAWGWVRRWDPEKRLLTKPPYFRVSVSSSLMGTALGFSSVWRTSLAGRACRDQLWCG